MQLITQGYVLERGTVTLLARVLYWDGELVVPSQVDTIEYTAYTVANGVRTPIPGHEHVPIADAILDELQKDDRWDRDSIGYNFMHTVDVRNEPLAANAGERILIAVTLMPVSGQPLRWDYDLKVL